MVYRETWRTFSRTAKVNTGRPALSYAEGHTSAGRVKGYG